ncbi:type 1 glutamine amidotransferase domain-containing protein [Eleftheria terrae]|uniref:type 1 glutamine amidotransferase domain-containing protein n=1 Tax=Eleftheria terrae TaxID=1597781 RepID=UPI00263BBD7A|nr:type 1 glutamine amidotransferase domain-containing protein [Eleftheria terrae]WKB55757.1 type 1 glutamine amidotransferase domain-containing protein [Eleftheria terrae]
MSHILIVLSAADHWTRADGSISESGVWAEELAEIDKALLSAGFHVDFASPAGVRPTVDKRSLDPKTVGEEVAASIRAYLDSNSGRLDKPRVLADIDVGAYDAIVVPGGHGPVEDLYRDTDMGRVLLDADRRGKVIAAVCHGPAALLAARDPSGGWPFAGRRMTAFSAEEEIEFGTAHNAPWLLAGTLRRLGARYEQGPHWEPFVVVDGHLITGQNPASSAALAEAVIAALR